MPFIKRKCRLMPGSYSTTVPVAEGYGSWPEAAGLCPQDTAYLLWLRDAWPADVPALRGRAGYSRGMIGRLKSFRHRAKQSGGFPRMGLSRDLHNASSRKGCPLREAGPPFPLPDSEYRTIISASCFVLLSCEEKILAECLHSTQNLCVSRIFGQSERSFLLS